MNWGWIIYLAGAVVAHACFVVAVNRQPIRELRWTMTSVSAAFLLLPWPNAAQSEHYSPAWIVAVLEGLFEGPQAFERAGKPLLICMLAVAIFSLAISLFIRYRSKRVTQSTKPKVAA